MKSSWLEFVQAKTEDEPSYVGEYANAIAVVQELIEMYGPEHAFTLLFLRNGIRTGAADDAPRPRQALRHRRVHPRADRGRRVQGVRRPAPPELQRLRRRLALQPPAPRPRLHPSDDDNHDDADRHHADRHNERGPGLMTEHFDYVFIGSGVAGATRRQAAPRARPLDVDPDARRRARGSGQGSPLLVGLHRLRPQAVRLLYDIVGENTTRGDIKWGYDGARVMAYGGSTLHWGAWCLRYKPEDFFLRTNTGEGADWPISYDDLDGYYYEAEQYLSVCGDVGESWNQHRADQPYPRPSFEWTAADGVMIEAMRKVGIEPGKMPIARYRKCMTTGHVQVLPVRISLHRAVRSRRSAGRPAARQLRAALPVPGDADRAGHEATHRGDRVPRHRDR